MLMITLVIFALAQRPTSSQQQQKQQQSASGQTMSMDQMMQECRKHCESTMTMLESVIRQAEDAKKSKEVRKMQLALENAQQQAQEMKNHIEMCRSMMDMMQMMQKKEPAKPPQK
jgi:CHASE1-domain containing sensor protein